MKKPTLFILDGMSCLYRAYHAIPAFTTSKGLPTNGVYGFAQTLKKILRTYSPDHICVAFDVKGPTFRHDLYEDYKVERPEMPDELGVQIPYVKELVRAFNIPVLEKEGFEADDVIATLVARFAGTGLLKLFIITGDKDMYQLVSDDVSILDYVNDKEFGPEAVVEKFGVKAEMIADLMGLAGDSSDNIPGVPGVGVKTAAKLLGLFGTLEGVLENVDRAPGKKLKENLAGYADQARLSKELATLHYDVPVAVDIDSLKYKGPDMDALEAVLKELEFAKLINELIPVVETSTAETNAVVTVEALDALAGRLSKSKGFAVTLSRGKEKDGLRPVTGIAFATAEDATAYVPLLEASGEGGDGGEGLESGVIKSRLAKLMSDGGVKKYTDAAKDLLVFFSVSGEGVKGIEVKGIVMDTSIASYLLNPTRFAHTLDNVAYEYLGERPAAGSEGGKGGEGNKGGGAAATSSAAIIIRLSAELDKKLDEAGLRTLFTGVELPLAGVLARMELAGVRIEKSVLQGLSKELGTELESLKAKIHDAAGYSFNINSPKQLSVLLFDKLGLKPLKKTKTGYSTDEGVLTALARVHVIPRSIIEYRQLAKLKGTYVDSILALVDLADGRVHTSFNQTVTATGRLSSSRPNLQNIPVKNEHSLKIREAFVAGPGSTFLSADYSQIELRLVAHFSKDPVLLEAFRTGQDVHTRTAGEVFGIDPARVPPDLRRRAKAINFGIIYGMGPWGLATELGISNAEAREYIDSYFSHYSSVKDYIDASVRVAIERGFTETLMGRRRFIPELMSPNEATRRFGERMAVNTPIQGSAADIIKAAMISVDKGLRDGAFRARMLLQIHDELVFEVPDEELGEIKALVTKEMEQVTSLDVPIIVNLGTGRTWRSVEK